MNENQDYNNDVTPYKASGNLNTMIANPSVNINDTMNVNIQNMATNSETVINSQLYNSLGQEGTSSVSINNNSVNNFNTNNSNVNSQNNNYSQIVNDQNSNYVNRTYVTTDNRPKKKTVKFNLGSEFRIALLIIVILLVFVFLLPMIYDMFRGY